MVIMYTNISVSVFLLLALTLLITLSLIFFRKRNTASNKQVNVVKERKTESSGQVLPNKIVVGTSPESPFVTIESLPSNDDYETAKPLDNQNSTSISRLSAICQLVPPLLVAKEASGKHLMEVLINGELVRAADGNGLRAFAMASDGIKEHARLFEVQNLQNAINVAAIWQVASVVVAQKHLADISRKLDEIKSGVLGISRFLDNQRKARILATYNYLRQIYEAIRGGDLPGAVQYHLESCERDLLEIQHHLEMEYRQKIDKKTEHKELFGTEELTVEISTKIGDLDLLAEDIALCMKTRIAAWHVLSLFPGKPQLKMARSGSIRESLKKFESLSSYCEGKIQHEISAIDAFWNTKTTLSKRRSALFEKCNTIVKTLETNAQNAWLQVQHSEQLMLSNDRPTRLLLQFENGEFVGVRQGSQ